MGFHAGYSEARKMEAEGRVSLDSVLAQLASSSGHNDQSTNIGLAKSLCRDEDHTAIAHVVGILQTGSKPQRKDAIKVLYEVGARNPGLIAPFTDVFFETMESRDNRIVWGALMALAKISSVQPERVADRMHLVLTAADNGSVIAKDQAIEILAALKSLPGHAKVANDALFDRLRTAATNQLPKYSEITAASLLPGEKEEFLSIIEMRLTEFMPESKRRCLHKVEKQVESSKS